MKFLIASDIHGSNKYLKMLLNAFESEKADKLILVGDILYHGPRNNLPEGYAPKEVITLLNSIKEKLICVRGNCDTEVDQMVLDFPILADYAVLPIKNSLIYITHGHKFGENNPLPLNKGDILLNGHTHIPKCENKGNFIYMNCGSVSIPKENSPHSYMTLKNNSFKWIDLETGKAYKQFDI